MSQGTHPASGRSATGHPKMRTVWLLTALLAAALPAHATQPPAVQWTKTFLDGCRCVQQTADAGYVAVGSVETDSDRIAAMIVKLDSSGAVQWVDTIKTYGGIVASSVVQTSDGGYIVAGAGGETDTSGSNTCLIRIGALGSVLWRSYLVDRTPVAQSVVGLDDTAYAVAMLRWLGNHGVLLLMADSVGRERWRCEYSIEYSDWETHGADLSLGKTADGGYIIGTKTLLKVDSLGHQQWLRVYDDMVFALSARQTSDRGYIATGASRNYGSISLLKTNSKGHTAHGAGWLKTYASSEQSLGYCVDQTLDGGYIVAGAVQPRNDWDRAILLRTSPNGTLLWLDTLCIGEANSVRQTTDGGYVVCGSRFDPKAGPEGTSYSFVAKLAPERKR
jgi:hypothetical protein